MGGKSGDLNALYVGLAPSVGRRRGMFMVCELLNRTWGLQEPWTSDRQSHQGPALPSRGVPSRTRLSSGGLGRRTLLSMTTWETKIRLSCGSTLLIRARSESIGVED